MSKKKITWLVVLLVVILGALYAYKEYTRVNADLSKVSPQIKITYSELLTEFGQDEYSANAKYLGKIIETDGPVKQVEISGDGHYTLIIGDTNSLSSIRCAIDSMHNKNVVGIKAGTSILIRGECTGFKKNELLGENLGSDVELNRSVIIFPKK